MKRMKRGLAVLLAMLLIMPVLPAYAREASQPEVAEHGDVVSDGDVKNGDVKSGEDLEPAGDVLEGTDAEGNQIMPYADAGIETGYVDGTSNAVSWTYDPATKETVVTGNGTRGSLANPGASCFPSETESIRFENCEIAGLFVSLFKGLEHLTSIDFTGLTMTNATDMCYMFYGCGSLGSLDLSGFDTRNTTDMSDMFSGCSSLGSLDLSSFDTSSVTDMGSMFSRCSSLGSLDLSSFDTSSVTDMGWMFRGCSSLNSLDLSSFATGSVTDMDSMFYGCSGLSSLDLSSFDTGSVADMRYMFYGCSSLGSLDMSSFATGSVTDMGSMFRGCSSLNSLDLSSFDTANVTDMYCMFYGCSGLSSLDLSSFDTGSVADMRYMFYGCSGLSSLDLSSFDTANVTDMYCMFCGCSSLSSLDVSSFDTSNVTDMSDAFYRCSSLAEIKSPHAIAERRHADLPATFYDADLYESTGEYRTMTVMDSSCAGKTLKKYSDDTSGDNGDDDITAEPLPDAVQYVMYEYTIPNASGSAQGMSLLDGTLPTGMELQADGKLRGIPMEAGRFVFTIGEAAEAAQTVSGGDDSTPATPKTYRLTVADNSDANVDVTTDPGYEIIQRVPDFTWDSVSSHTLVSVGDYGEFRDVYIDGVRLEKGKDYTSESGSTRITIRSETLERFSEPGVHTILVEFRTTESNDLRRAVQNYWVAGPSGDDANEGNVGSGSTGSSGDGSGSTDDDDGNDGDGSTVNQNNAAASTPIKYMVARGDVLGRIARRNGISLTQLLAWNPQIKNPNLIFPGQIIVVGYAGGSMEAPALQSLEGAVYDVVQKGDSLYRIAVRNGVSLDKVAALNPELMKQKYIYPGQKVRVK